MNKLIFIILTSATTLLSNCGKSNDNGTGGKVPPPSTTTLKMVDHKATAETKALYANLWQIQKIGTMFGHHDYAAYGVGWRDVPGKSDVKDVCGDYPAVFSTDLSGVEQKRTNNVNDIPITKLRTLIQDVYRRGGITMMVWHQENPKTGGIVTDPTKCVDEILVAGSELNAKYKSWLDNVADFFNNLTDDNGKLIPIIFRPLHEHTQVWSWWGSAATSDKEFVEFWRMIVTYLRDTKGVHNLIYAISPQMDENYGAITTARLQYRWPGDNFVDFVGMDCYNGTNTEAFNSNLYHLSMLSAKLKKPVGVTESGIEKNHPLDYWTKQISTPISQQGVQCSMVTMWRNESVNHALGPYPSDPSAADFIRLYNNSKMIFERKLPNMYKSVEGITVE